LVPGSVAFIKKLTLDPRLFNVARRPTGAIASKTPVAPQNYFITLEGGKYIEDFLEGFLTVNADHVIGWTRLSRRARAVKKFNAARFLNKFYGCFRRVHNF
jgi:hypothetical protein